MIRSFILSLTVFVAYSAWLLPNEHSDISISRQVNITAEADLSAPEPENYLDVSNDVLSDYGDDELELDSELSEIDDEDFELDEEDAFDGEDSLNEIDYGGSICSKKYVKKFIRKTLKHIKRVYTKKELGKKKKVLKILKGVTKSLKKKCGYASPKVIKKIKKSIKFLSY